MEIFKYRFSVKKHLVTGLLLLLALLIMVTPALANTSNWSFVGTTTGNVVNGAHNGVFHTMSAGTMILNGNIWATNAPGSNVEPWTFRIFRDEAFGVPDTLVCSLSPVYPSTTAYQTVSVYKNCGFQSAATYYFIIFRGQSDGRAVSGSGTLST